MDPPAPAEMEALVEMSVPQDVVPKEVRLGFVKKVYAIVGTMLLVTLAVAISVLLLFPDSLDTKHCAKCFGVAEANSSSNSTATGDVDSNDDDPKSKHCKKCWKNAVNSWCIVTGFLVLVLVPPFIRMLAICFPGCTYFEDMRSSFDKMMSTSPWNYMYLYAVCISEGLMWAAIVENFTKKFAASFPIVLLAMVIIIFGITLATAWFGTEFDGARLQVAVLVGGLVPGSLRFLLVHATLVDSMFTAFITACLSYTAIRETKAIFGVGSQPRRGALTYDMYAFGAYDVYMTTVVFIGMGC